MAKIIKKYRSAAIDCTIIERHNRHGRAAQARCVILQRREQDTSGVWHSSTQFRPQDLPAIIALMSRAHRELLDFDLDAFHERPADVDLDAIGRPEMKQLHDAIAASMIGW